MIDTKSWDRIARYALGECSALEALETRAWIDADPERRALADELVRIADVGPSAIWDAREAWKRLVVSPAIADPGASSVEGHRAPRNRQATVPRRERRIWRYALSVAAVVLLALGLFRFGVRPSGNVGFGAREFITGAAERVTVQLDDGSVVRLAPTTRLRFTGTPQAREVWLEGQAYFAVAKDRSRPFRIRTPQGEAVVLGTRFDLRANRDSLRLIVVEGRVAVTAQGQRVDAGAGEVAAVTERTSPRITKVANAIALVDWVGRFLAFDATPVEQVVTEIQLRYGVRIRIVDSALVGQRVTGEFTDQSAEDVLDAVCRALAVPCRTSNGIVHIGR